INATVHETFIKPAAVPAPQEWSKEKSEQVKKELLAKCFHGWPEKAPPLGVKPAGDVKSDGLRLRAFDFTSEEAIDLRLWLLTAEKEDRPTLVVLTAADEAGWNDWANELGPAFGEILQLGTAPKSDDAKRARTRKALETTRWAFATIAPRGVGPT